MKAVLLTKSKTFLIGWIASLLGLIMAGIFNFLDLIKIPNIGLSIILFTVVVYVLMLPLTIKQQKFAKLSAKMNPELQAIQAKYKNKTDQESRMQMQSETSAVYAKYGVSPTGGCVQLLIQMPILLALYQVIYRIPAYVKKIGDTFGLLAQEIINKNLVDEVKGFSEAAAYAKNFDVDQKLAVIDVLNKMNSTDLINYAQEHGFAQIKSGTEYVLSQLNDKGEIIQRGLIDKYNNFLGLNMANSPSSVVKTAMAAGKWALVIAAIAIPVLAAVTQFINVKLMPQQEKSGNGSDTMASSMKTMNMIMPIMSAFFCYTLPSGMGLYWIAGSVVRSIQQVIINKRFDKMDLSQIIEANKEKSAKKMEKLQAQQARLQQYANMNTKNIGGTSGNKYTQKANYAAQKNAELNQNDNASDPSSAATSSSGSAKPGSLMARANMVKDYNERNNKK